MTCSRKSKSVEMRAYSSEYVTCISVASSNSCLGKGEGYKANGACMTDVSKDVDSDDDGVSLNAGLYTNACESAQSLAVWRRAACSCSLIAGGHSGRTAFDMDS